MLSDAICRYLYLLHACFSTRFNAEKQFLMAQNRCMKACLARHGFDYPVLEPEEKKELLRLGALLDHKVKDLFVVNTWSTYRRWRRIERKGGEVKKPGLRRIIPEAICQLVVRMARENTDWGLRRIAGEIRKLGASISGPSVKAILKRHGMEPPDVRGVQFEVAG